MPISMSGQDESALIERVFLRIGSAETDEQFQTALGKFLSPVILKLNSSDESVRKKVMELLVHINKRLKSRPNVQLPVDTLITQFQDPSASSIITNFSIIYIKMGFPRLDKEKQATLVPLLINCLKGKPQSQRDSLLQLLIPAMQYIKFPSDAKQRQAVYGLTDQHQTSGVLLDYMMDLLLLPYSAHVAAIQNRPSSAQPDATPPPTAPVTPTPPGLSEYSFRRVAGDNALTPEALEKAKIGVLKFLGAGILAEEDVICHYIVAAADTRHSVATAADMELKRILGSIDWNNQAIIKQLFSVFQGTVDIKGKTETKPELKRKPVCTRIRLKIFPYFLKSREACNTFPSCIQVTFDCLYGQTTNSKLKLMATQFVHHLCLHCADNKFAPIGPVLLSGMVKLVGEAKEDAKLRGLAYVAAGKIVRRSPQIVSKDIGIVQKFFDAMCQEDAETRLSVQEALSLMSEAFHDISGTNATLMEALVMQNIDKEQPQARLVAVQYAKAVFPTDHMPSRYVLLLASGDNKEDVRTEAMKALKSKQTTEKVPSKSSAKEELPKMPKFSSAMMYIKQKADQRVLTQHKVTAGNHVMAFNSIAYEQMVLYLRSCLACEAGVIPNTDSLSDMQDQAPAISKFLLGMLNSDSLQTYIDFIKHLLTVVGGTSSMYCLLELVSMAPGKLSSQFMKNLDWIKRYIFSSKDELKTYASQLHATVLCHQADKTKISDAILELSDKISSKSFEVQQGSIIALGYLIGQYLRMNSNGMETDSSVDAKLSAAMGTAVHNIVKLLKPTDEVPDPLLPSICLAIGEIGRNSALLLPSGAEGDGQEKITKLSLIKVLLKMVTSGKETNKTKEKAALCLGYICVGEEEFPYRRKVIEQMMEAAQAKQIELNMTIGDALVFSAQGITSAAARNVWTETVEEFNSRTSKSVNEVAWYMDLLLNKYIVNVNPHLRQAACIWLLALVKSCNMHEALQSNLLEIQRAFMKMLSENDDVTQDIASKGLGLVYEVCSSKQKDQLVAELVDTLMTGKRAKQEVTGESKIFEQGSIGKTPDGGSLSTYKELCSMANDLNQPDLIYKFMHLANHNAMWNSKKGAAFGFSTIAAQAGEQLAPYLHKLVPRLYRYQFDPNPKIQLAMSSIWQAVVQDNNNTVEKYMKEIAKDLIKNLTNTQWRIRESSCLAVSDLLRGRPVDDIVDLLPDLWENCLRVRDDIKESVRNAADVACRSLSRVSIKICDVNYGKVGEQATKAVLPCLLKNSIQSSVSEVRAIGLSTILKISKNAGSLLKPHIPILVTALLEAVSGLEPQVLNYYSLRVSDSQAAQDQLDSARIAASKMSPMMETVNLCVQYVDEEVLTELVPRITDLIKSGIGIGTKAGCSSFVISLVHHCPKDLSPHAGNYKMCSETAFLFLQYTYSCLQYIPCSYIDRLHIQMKQIYFTCLSLTEESARLACGLTLHSMSQHSPDILKRHATLAMPLAFFAMHEQKPEEQKSKNPEDSLSIWDEVWLEVTPGTEAGIRLYIQEIVQILRESIESQSWNTKAQAALSMATVASKLQAQLGPPHLGNLLSALLIGLQGKTWTGKEALLQAVKTVCTSCKKSIENSDTEGQPSISQVVEAVMKECRKERLAYKLEALQCMGSILEEYKLDHFKDMWDILSPTLLKKDKEDKEEDDDEIKPEQKQNQLLCYYDVLGQAWPYSQSTQDEYSQRFHELLCSSLPRNTWKIQTSLLKTTHKFLDRHCCFCAKRVSEHPEQCKPLLERTLEVVIPCMENLKYTVIRTEALNVIKLIVNRLKESSNLRILSNAIEQQITECLTVTAKGEVNPELKDSAKELLKSVQGSTS
ncbi:proteasome adapter and scaffold protein ECM29-like [Ylistrum balloti]|uniref:proteasome adapter and scaffold protein ECM29-like n=1 Tax=Ylistrum balloti TaxID=509963 RepID=UPI00290580F5|nr:proteasome adapter and scaffold protein ECM29-like [Ylistrum balloti]